MTYQNGSIRKSWQDMSEDVSNQIQKCFYGGEFYPWILSWQYSSSFIPSPDWVFTSVNTNSCVHLGLILSNFSPDILKKVLLKTSWEGSWFGIESTESGGRTEMIGLPSISLGPLSSKMLPPGSCRRSALESGPGHKRSNLCTPQATSLPWYP